ncbi:MAG: 50S ribosome-binding GTPase [Pirellulales bacterium]|nr:50S ribosome-binding GTPase [Pirellulales bacterium]
MSFHTEDTIVAVASAQGGAARGVLRLSGPAALDCAGAWFVAEAADVDLGRLRAPSRVRGLVRIGRREAHPPLSIPAELLAWPSCRSYTRQPLAEIHTIGSPPLVGAILDEAVRCGARLAGPGEFTLRAFLAGRIDLTQAEAVLGVIDAGERAELDAALDQLAGGLSGPLHALREKLLGLLAELEAGLDFVEEDIEFIDRRTLQRQLAEAQNVVEAALSQLSRRDQRAELPRVAIVGPPNAGKSSLFNALAEQFGAAPTAQAIVSATAGATRDYVVARVRFDGVACELIDTAGEGDQGLDDLQAAARQMTQRQHRTASLVVRCTAAAGAAAGGAELAPEELHVVTKSDLLPEGSTTHADSGEQAIALGGAIGCSAWTGDGLHEVAAAVRARLRRAANGASAAVAATAARCRGSLRTAEQALDAAAKLVDRGDDELIAAEIRIALDGLGEVVGGVSSEDVLDRVFSQFCVGK